MSIQKTRFGSSATARCAIALVAVTLLMEGCDRTESKDATVATTGPSPARQVVRTASRGPLKVTITADNDRIQIPQTIRLTVRIEVEAGVEVQVPKLEGVIGEFAVADVTENDPPCDAYTQCKEWLYTLEAYLPGVHQIPALPFAFKDAREKADGTNDVYEDEFSTPPIEITVTEVLADIKNPVDLPMPFRYRLLWWAVGAIATIVAIAMAVRLWRRRSRPEFKTVAAPIVAHVWALRELDRLAKEDLIGRGLIHEFYCRINGLVRRYIELRFGLMAGEQTSEEFILALQHSDFFSAAHKGMLREFIAACDPVKYARHEPQRDEIDWVQLSAREFVLETADDSSEGNGAGSRLATKQEAAA